MSQLDRLTVRGFKSIRALEEFKLGRLNVLIGANGAGKSNFMSVFRMMAELAEGRLQLFVRDQDGPDALAFGTRKQTDRIDVELHFTEGSYLLSLKPAGDRLVFLGEDKRSLGPLSNSPAMNSSAGYPEALLAAIQVDPDFHQRVWVPMTRWRVYHFNDTSHTAHIRQTQPVRDNLRLKEDGRNLAPFLRRLRDNHLKSYQRIVDTIRQVAPFFGDFVYRKDPGERMDIEWLGVNDPDTVLGPRQLSDGTLRFICLATLLLQPAELQPETILIDEPELGLHPFAVAVLAALLRQVSDERQLIVSTQSVELLNELNPENIIVVGRKDDASTFEHLDAERLKEWLKDYALGELWKMNVLGGRPSQ